MWRTHLTVGLRSLRRDPLFTAINLFGLAVGLAGCLLIILFIRYERSFDSWLPDAQRIYQVQRLATSGTDAGRRSGETAFVATTAMRPEFPEIEAATGIVQVSGVFRRDGEPFDLNYVYATDAAFLDVLRLPLVAGDPRTALADVDTIVLTETAARRLFGRTDVLGLTIPRIGAAGDRMLRVTGVLRDLPPNTHMRINALYRPNLAARRTGNEVFTDWNWVSAWVYVRLRPGADPGALEQRMVPALQRLVPTNLRDISAPDRLGFTQRLMNVRAINTASLDSGTMRAGTSAKTLLTFAIVAAFLLVVACVNFTNLATARASRRAREVGLRKTLGATRFQLVVQFLLEASVIVGLAGLLATALAELALPLLNDLIDGEMAIRYFGTDGILLPLVAVLLVVALLGGVYPAFFLSRYRPALVLKASQSGAEAPGAGRLRLALVVVQFAVSIGLIVCTAIIQAQTLFARSTDPGYRVPGLLFVGNPGAIGERPQIEAFMHRLAAIPGVQSVARTGVTPNPDSTATTNFRMPGATDNVVLQIVPIDGATFATLGMRMRAGRSVSDQREADVGAPLNNADPERTNFVRQRGLNVVIDESAARLLGFADPQAAVGREVRREDSESGEGSAPYTIVGVVDDARFESARFESFPKIYYVAPAGHLALAVRFDPGRAAAVMAAAQALWKSAVRTDPFTGFFADARIADMYAGDGRRARMFAIFAAFAVLISCLGLFGLSAFTAERRTKEIGIRKVLGARVRDIVRLLVWQFTRPVLLANLIAWPVAWWAMRDWLDEFQSRIDITPTPFVTAGLMALIVASVTIIGHAVRVARANPIHALRYE
ncbi:MAG: ABC transporter permease [Sphingomonadaceae bacterium]|nr:ABC transporter permease [Sphingomonadaceae bacterium]